MRSDNIVDESDNLSVSEAARMLNKSDQFVRIALQQKIVDFGFAVKMSSRWTYHISRAKLMSYLKN